VPQPRHGWPKQRRRCGCGAEYKGRIERIAEGTPFAGVSCGAVGGPQGRGVHQGLSAIRGQRAAHPLIGIEVVDQQPGEAAAAGSEVEPVLDRPGLRSFVRGNPAVDGPAGRLAVALPGASRSVADADRLCSPSRASSPRAQVP